MQMTRTLFSIPPQEANIFAQTHKKLRNFETLQNVLQVGVWEREKKKGKLKGNKKKWEIKTEERERLVEENFWGRWKEEDRNENI